MLTGGCHCGAVRYEARKIESGSLCHCTDCRRTSGAPAVAWFSVRRDDWRLISGELRDYRSSDHATRSFCAACGAQICVSDDDAPELLDVTTATLDDPSAAPPIAHIYTRSRIAWFDLADELPRYAAARED